MLSDEINKATFEIRNVNLFVDEQEKTAQSLSAVNIEVIKFRGLNNFHKTLTNLVSQILLGVCFLSEALFNKKCIFRIYYSLTKNIAARAACSDGLHG